MALRKSRFFHFQTPFGRYHGFSALLQPNDDPTKVGLSVAFCSKKDQFCRACGRSAALAAKEEVIPVVDLPNKLRELVNKSEGYEYIERPLKQLQSQNNRYTWIWKYFL